MNNKHKRNFFKKEKKETTLKTNNRWKNFQNTIEPTNNEGRNERMNAFHSSNNRFDNLKNDSKGRGERGGRGGRGGRGERGGRGGRGGRGSRFGKRVYKSKFNKEEVFDYFNNEKNATQRSVSLFNCIEQNTLSKKTKNKTLNKDNIQETSKKKEKKEEMTKETMSTEEKMFILNQYMYEEESDDEQEDEIEEKTTQSKDIIDF